MSDEGDTPDQAPQAAAGPFAAEDRTFDSRPRRVLLRRDRNGSYCIFMGRRMIQGFCSEFEDITRFALAPDMQLQVRIQIQPIGALHPATYPDEEPPPPIRHLDPGQAVRIRTTDEGIEQEEVALFSQAHPQGIETWQNQARRQVHEQMTRLQDMLNLLESM